MKWEEQNKFCILCGNSFRIVKYKYSFIVIYSVCFNIYACIDLEESCKECPNSIHKNALGVGLYVLFRYKQM